MDSILNTTKKLLGIPVEDTAFDIDILVLINGALATLFQLGVGPEDPLLVADKDTEWTALTTDVTIQSFSKTFIFLNVRLAFDPPQNSFVTESFKRQIDELTWRIEVQANPYVPPVPPVEV